MDWFVLLTPVLLLPIALLLFFVGCSLLFEPGDPDANDPTVVDDMDDVAEVRIQMRFPSPDPNDNCESYRFEIEGLQDAIINEIDAETFSLGADGIVSFDSTYMVSPGAKTLFCRVFDLCNPSPGNTPLVRPEQQGCEVTLVAGESYVILFETGSNDNRFEPCAAVQTS